MGSPLHINLFLDEEQLSAAPVRLKVLLPIAAAAFAAIVIMSAAVLHAMTSAVIAEEMGYTMDMTSKRPEYEKFGNQRKEADALRAAVTQVNEIKSSKICIADELRKLAEGLPMTMQFKTLDYKYDKLPGSMPARAEPAPTNTSEVATFRISGRTIDPNRIKSLLDRMRSEDFEDFIAEASIESGSYKDELRIGQPQSPTSDAKSVKLFTIAATCQPRVFREEAPVVTAPAPAPAQKGAK